MFCQHPWHIPTPPPWDELRDPVPCVKVLRRKSKLKVTSITDEETEACIALLHQRAAFQHRLFLLLQPEPVAAAQQPYQCPNCLVFTLSSVSLLRGSSQSLLLTDTFTFQPYVSTIARVPLCAKPDGCSVLPSGTTQDSALYLLLSCSWESFSSNIYLFTYVITVIMLYGQITETDKKNVRLHKERRISVSCEFNDLCFNNLQTDIHVCKKSIIFGAIDYIKCPDYGTSFTASPAISFTGDSMAAPTQIINCNVTSGKMFLSKPFL